jgi:hypothetical protein
LGRLVRHILAVKGTPSDNAGRKMDAVPAFEECEGVSICLGWRIAQNKPK